MNADTLNSLVTSAIWRAEQLDDLGVSTARLAWAEVSVLEEELASVIPVSQPEGRIARRGAVRAALKSSDYSRVDTLIRRYSEEDGVPAALQTAIGEMLDEDARNLAERFRYATKHHPIDEVRDLARWIGQAGAFGLAA